MTKVKESFAFQEYGTSAKHNRSIDDYITRGQLILHSTGDVLEDEVAIGVPSPNYLGWYPYNPLKQLYDHLRVHWVLTFSSGTGTLEISTDSGAVWLEPSAGALGLPMSTPIHTEASARTYDVDLSSVAAFGWLGFRIVHSDTALNWIAWNVQAYLWSVADDPF